MKSNLPGKFKYIKSNQNFYVSIYKILSFCKIKMSVKVAVRVRPFNERELKQDPQCCIEMRGKQTIIRDLLGATATGSKPAERAFTFDYSFQSHDGFTENDQGKNVPDGAGSTYADQAHVYDVLGKQVLDNAWEGYHCCLFAYGQTGSGKSYSMVGFGKNEGIVPMACNEIFRRISANTDPDTRYEVQFSMLEIYNERVQDLLQADQTARPRGGLKVRESQKGDVYVEGLSKHAVDSYQRIAQKMDVGYTSRTIGATQMNQTSSRAHTIVTIEFKQVRQEGGRRLEKFSVINLVDLAGSEKAGQTGAEGARLKEGCAINKSLTVLGSCISVLADKAGGKQKSAVVPYRDSSLTRILQGALGGNSKTIMVCAVSPAALNYEESLSTLRYADRAKKIVNKAVVNESVQDKLIRELKGENDSLKRALMEAARSGKLSIDLKALGLGDFVANTSDIQNQVDISDQQIQEMERTWEEKLERQRQKDEAERRQQQQESEQQLLKNKKAPHLTNLNEDTQLSGKLYYSLQDLASSRFNIGRQDGNPKPQLVLRGVGIQQQHAYFEVDGKGVISICVTSGAACEQTLVNGKQLVARAITDSNQVQVYGLALNHLDRICIGVGTVFLFKYPLQKYMRSKIMEDIGRQNPNMDPEEMETVFERRLQTEGICPPLSDPNALTCEEYTASQVAEDESAATDCFEWAMQEAHQAEQFKQQMHMHEQQRQFDQEKVRLEQHYQEQYIQMKKKEEEKVTELKKQQDELQFNLKVKEEQMKLYTLQQAKEQEQQLLQFEESNKDKVDVKEVNKLQEELDRVRKQIEWQDKVNTSILKEQTERLLAQMKAAQEQIELRRSSSVKEAQQEIDHSENARKVQEANEICRMIGSNIKFRQLFVRSMVDDSGRSMTLLGKGGQPGGRAAPRMKEELQIQVQNYDRGGQMMMWTEQQFEDRLAMMRDAQVALEAQRQAAANLEGDLSIVHEEDRDEYDKSQFQSEVFDDVGMDDADFEDGFLSSLVTNVDTDFLKNQNMSSVQPSRSDAVASAKTNSSPFTSSGPSLPQSQSYQQNSSAESPKISSQPVAADSGRPAAYSKSMVETQNANISPGAYNDVAYARRMTVARNDEQQQIDQRRNGQTSGQTIGNQSAANEPGAQQKQSLSHMTVEQANNIQRQMQGRGQGYNNLQTQNLKTITPVPPQKQSLSGMTMQQAVQWQQQQQANKPKDGGTATKQASQGQTGAISATQSQLEAQISRGLFQQSGAANQPPPKQNLTSISMLQAQQQYSQIPQMQSQWPTQFPNQPMRQILPQPQPQYQYQGQSLPTNTFVPPPQKARPVQQQPTIQKASHPEEKKSATTTTTRATTSQLPDSSMNLLGLDDFVEITTNEIAEARTSQVKAAQTQESRWATEYNAAKAAFNSSFFEQKDLQQRSRGDTLYSASSESSEKGEAASNAQKSRVGSTPQGSVSGVDEVEVKQAFLWNILSQYTPIQVVTDLFLKPIPLCIGYVQCSIERHSSGMSKLFPKYTLRLTDGNKIMMTAEKIANSATSHYKITVESVDAGANSEDRHLGRLRGNFGSTQFYIYGTGYRPDQKIPNTSMRSSVNKTENDEIRRQYGTILYTDKDSFGKKMPRKMEVYLPQIPDDGNSVRSWKDTGVDKKGRVASEYQKQETNSSFSKSQERNKTGIMRFNTKHGDSSEFEGRVCKPSKKNFRLTDEVDAVQIYLQFARAGQHTFNVDVAHPFSIYQAFAVCLSAFDLKW